MMSNQDNDYFLSRWMSGTITDAELEQKVGAEEFKAYRSLRDSLDRLQLPEPDLNQNYASVKQKKITALDQKPIRKRLFYWYAAAATLLLFFGMYKTFVFSNVQTATSGKTTNVELPDGSDVVIGAQSKVCYPSLLALNRTIRLQGKAYFKVQKGNTFTVESPHGKVQVLGTQFSVADFGNCLEVICYEGRVKVTQHSQSTVIGEGEAVRYYQNKPENWRLDVQKPEWLQNSTTFKNAPLEFVLTQLGHQYGRAIDYPDAVQSVRFTGSITHENLDNALLSVCIPLQMQYHILPDGKITIAE